MRRQPRQTKIGRLALLDLAGLSQYEITTIVLNPTGDMTSQSFMETDKAAPIYSVEMYKYIYTELHKTTWPVRLW